VLQRVRLSISPRGSNLFLFPRHHSYLNTCLSEQELRGDHWTADFAALSDLRGRML